MNPLEIAVKLLEQKQVYKEALKRLEEMQGTVKKAASNDQGHKDEPRCHTIKFESDYTTHLYWYVSDDDGELNMLLVDTAIKHIQDKLQGIEVLTGLANMALEKVMNNGR